MRYNTICTFILFFLVLLEAVNAVPFNVTISPTSLNAGQLNQVVNFSISNNGTVNITQVNITSPTALTFTGSSGTTTAAFTFYTNPIGWFNSSSIGIVGNGSAQYFWININTPITTGSYSFNVSVMDSNNTFNSTNITMSVIDTIAPTYSNNVTSPSSNTTYLTGQEYWVNMTWTDGVEVSKVLIEHNFTGSSTPHNESMSNSSSVYYIKFNDLGAGTYVWRVYANDTSNAFNSTPQLVYLINQALNIPRIFLNGVLNSNITSLNNTAINVTVNSSCTQSSCSISITLDDSSTLVSSGANPVQYISNLTSIGLHKYAVGVTGNSNYTSNTSTYFVATVSTYSTSTLNIPLSYSNTTISSINITFDTNPQLSNVFIQLDWSGTPVNYTMSNFSGLRYYYNQTFPGGTRAWKIYGFYFNHSVNLTPSNSFTIDKATPTITLSIVPEWTLDTPIETKVSCSLSVSGLTVNLYRNGTSATNPDVQTFKAGDKYIYLCNNTENQNYTVNEVKNTLFIRPKPIATLSFDQVQDLIEIGKNSTYSTELKVKNTGTVNQEVTLNITGMDKKMYSITEPTITIVTGKTGTFTINFNTTDSDIKEYKGTYEAKSVNTTISQNFTLKVLPSNETKNKIVDALAIYKLEVSKFENSFDQFKSQGINVSSLETKLNELKSLVNQFDSNVNSKDYFSAYQKTETIKSLVTEIENQLKALTPKEKVQIPKNVWIIVIGAIVAVIIGFMLYLFWPVKEGYREGQGEYVRGRAGLWEKIKNMFSRRKKTGEVEIKEG